MDKTKPAGHALTKNIESVASIVIAIVFVAVIFTAWFYAMDVRRMVAANNTMATEGAGGVIAVEHIRALAESQIADGRAYFLLGSKQIFEKQKSNKEALLSSLTDYEQKYKLPQVGNLVGDLRSLMAELQGIFDQAMEFRDKQTESKIVGQFYQAKTVPILARMEADLQSILDIQKADSDRVRRHEREAALEAELKIPRGMAWFCGVLAILFLSMCLIIFRMVRGRSVLYAERERLFNETKVAVEARNEIIDAISQDLKDPLTTIRSAVDRLESEKDPQVIRDAIQSVHGTSLTIEGLIKDICDQTKADTGTLALRLDQLGVSEVLDEARVALEPLAKQRDVRLQFETVNPPVLAFFDRERVIRVLANLVGNAIKFSPKQSKVIIKVRSDQQFVNISVSDSGPGIAAKNLPRLFGNFWQARKTADQGPGMGLAIVKTTVEAHGGKVKVESHPGHGSTFTFSLPRRRPVGAQFKRSIPQVRTVAPPSAAP